MSIYIEKFDDIRSRDKKCLCSLACSNNTSYEWYATVMNIYIEKIWWYRITWQKIVYADWFAQIRQVMNDTLLLWTSISKKIWWYRITWQKIVYADCNHITLKTYFDNTIDGIEQCWSKKNPKNCSLSCFSQRRGKNH